MCIIDCWTAGEEKMADGDKKVKRLKAKLRRFERKETTLLEEANESIQELKEKRRKNTLWNYGDTDDHKEALNKKSKGKI